MSQLLVCWFFLGCSCTKNIDDIVKSINVSSITMVKDEFKVGWRIEYACHFDSNKDVFLHLVVTSGGCLNVDSPLWEIRFQVEVQVRECHLHIHVQRIHISCIQSTRDIGDSSLAIICHVY